MAEPLTLDTIYLIVTILSIIGGAIGYLWARAKSEGKRDANISNSFKQTQTSQEAMSKEMTDLKTVLNTHILTSATALAELQETRKEVKDHESRVRVLENTSTENKTCLSNIQKDIDSFDTRLRAVEDRTSQRIKP